MNSSKPITYFVTLANAYKEPSDILVATAIVSDRGTDISIEPNHCELFHDQPNEIDRLKMAISRGEKEFTMKGFITKDGHIDSWHLCITPDASAADNDTLPT